MPRRVITDKEFYELLAGFHGELLRVICDDPKGRVEQATVEGVIEVIKQNTLTRYEGEAG
ncbi:hypothetical protein [Ponticoccus litoralis]|uniref:Uncharacterized protein n=1 Tax=Ponticoccus litoralis TaxID=422297 RepID=A0AAW9SHQ7_9RHOB